MIIKEEFLNKLITSTINTDIYWEYEEYIKLYDTDTDHNLKRYTTVIDNYTINFSLPGTTICVYDNSNKCILVINTPVDKINNLYEYIIHSKKLEKLTRFLDFK